MRSRHLSSSSLVALLVAAAPLMAQGVSAQLGGRVLDTKGSAVAGATVAGAQAINTPPAVVAVAAGATPASSGAVENRFSALHRAALAGRSTSPYIACIPT